MPALRAPRLVAVSARVRIEDGPDGLVLVYRRYQVRRFVKTGTRDLVEAERMAEELSERLEREQQDKAARRAEWRPRGLDVPRPPAPSVPAGPFNAPRIVTR